MSKSGCRHGWTCRERPSVPSGGSFPARGAQRPRGVVLTLCSGSFLIVMEVSSIPCPCHSQCRGLSILRLLFSKSSGLHLTLQCTPRAPGTPTHAHHRSLSCPAGCRWQPLSYPDGIPQMTGPSKGKAPLGRHCLEVPSTSLSCLQPSPSSMHTPVHAHPLHNTGTAKCTHSTHTHSCV